MVFSKELLLKGGAGLATAAAGGTGIYYGVDHFGNQLTKFDQGLIDHLRAGGNIQFAVLDSNNSGTALSSFPSLSSNDQTIIATVKVTIDGNDAGTKGKIIEKKEAKGEEKGTKKYLKSLNRVTDWTWSCEIKFKKVEGSNGASTLKDENLIFKSSGDDGFLNKLKKESGEEKLKIKFIENCGKERGKDKNRMVNNAGNLSSQIDDVVGSSNELKSSKEFKLRKGDENKKERGGSGNESTGSLYFVSESEFDTWFSVQK